MIGTFDDHNPRAQRVLAATERFIEEHLVGRIVEALRYEYRPQPKGFDGLGGRIPDFTVLNAGPVVVGELKKPNRIDDARSESVEYLDLIEERPVVGIATDGWGSTRRPWRELRKRCRKFADSFVLEELPGQS